jgi:DNA replication protein DnaC
MGSPNTYVFGSYVKPKVLILDDFAIKSMTPDQAEDIYELIAERMINTSFIITVMSHTN